MRVFVASAMRNSEVVRNVQTRFRMAGSSTTLDWTDPRVALLPRPELTGLMIDAIRGCDLFVLVCPTGSTGTIGLGVALATGKKCVVVGDPTIIEHRNVLHVPTVDSLFAEN